MLPNSLTTESTDGRSVGPRLDLTGCRIVLVDLVAARATESTTVPTGWCRHACYHACMAQITIRANDDLVQRVKRSASDLGRSMNDYVTSVLDAATDPDLAGTSAERLRERLRSAGLLATPSRMTGRRPSASAVAAAGTRAAAGRPVSEFVSDGR